MPQSLGLPSLLRGKLPPMTQDRAALFSADKFRTTAIVLGSVVKHLNHIVFSHVKEALCRAWCC